MLCDEVSYWKFGMVYYMVNWRQ